MVDAVEKKKEDIGTQKECTKIHDLGFPGKKAYGRPCKSEKQGSDESGYENREYNRRPCAAIGAFFLAGTDILADKRCGSHGHALHGQHNKLIQLIITTPSGHAVGTEVIDIGLDKHIGKGGDNGLYPGGKTDGEYLPENAAVQMQIFPGQAVDIPGPCQKQQCQACRNGLRENGGQCYTSDARVKDQYKEQIQKNIEYAGQYQKHERTGRIAYGTENAASHIIDEEPGYTEKVYGEVRCRVLKDVVRCVHEAKHRPDGQGANGGEQDTEEECGGHGCLNGVVQAIHIPGAEVLSDDDTGTYGKSIEEENQNIDDHSCGTYGSKCFLADIIAHDNGVYRVVEHLKNIAEHERERKQDNLPDDRTMCHIPCGCLSDACHTVICFREKCGPTDYRRMRPAYVIREEKCAVNLGRPGVRRRFPAFMV